MKKHSHNQVLRNDKAQKTKDIALLEREDTALFKECPKFESTQRDRELGFDRALTFLNLIESKCPKREALTFSQRRLCKYDSTLKRDGPAHCRKLKPFHENKKTANGWFDPGQDMVYDCGAEFEPNAQKFCLETEEDRQIANHFAKSEAKIKNDFKAKIQNLQQFFHEMNQKYNYSVSELGIKECRKRVQQAFQESKSLREKPIQYVQRRGVKFFHVIDELKEDPQETNPTIINQMKAFKPLVSQKSKYKIKEALVTDLFRHLNNQDPEAVSPTSGDLFKKIESETLKVMRLAETSGVSDAMNSNQRGKRLAPTDTGTSADRELFAQEFNECQYIFKVKEVNNLVKDLRNKKLQQLQEKADESNENSPLPTVPSPDNPKKTLFRYDSSFKPPTEQTEEQQRTEENEDADDISVLKRGMPMNARQIKSQAYQQKKKDLRFKRTLNNFIRKSIETINPKFSSPDLIASNSELEQIQENKRHLVEREMRRMSAATSRIKPSPQKTLSTLLSTQSRFRVMRSSMGSPL